MNGRSARRIRKAVAAQQYDRGGFLTVTRRVKRLYRAVPAPEREAWLGSVERAAARRARERAREVKRGD